MVGCATPFCNNSVDKGYIMKTFPRNAERRALWAKNVSERYWGNGVKNWMPATNSFLCEVHFASDMWEPRTDVQKLKSNAYPTIFGYFLKKKLMENNIKQVLTENNQANNKTGSNESYQPLDIQLNESIAYIQKQECQVNKTSKKITFRYLDIQGCKTNFLDKCNEKVDRCKKLEDVNRKLRRNIIKMRKEIKILKNIIYISKNKFSNKYKLFTKKRCVRMWSNDIIQCALQLKFICGNNGYKELIRQGYPLPNTNIYTNITAKTRKFSISIKNIRTNVTISKNEETVL
ncbi:THAP2 protein, partial [Pseudoatta argentina]